MTRKGKGYKNPKMHALTYNASSTYRYILVLCTPEHAFTYGSSATVRVCFFFCQWTSPATPVSVIILNW